VTTNKTRRRPVIANKPTGKARKLRFIEDAAKNVVPTMSATKKDRSRWKRNGLDGGAARRERQAMRRIAKQKFALVALENLDQRSHAFKRFRSVIRGVTSDMGGSERISTTERVLIEAFSAATVRMEDLAARQLLGDQKVEYSELASAISSLVRVAKRLGTERRPKDIQPLSSYLNGKDTIEGEILSDDQ
jgi:hypothetical protein